MKNNKEKKSVKENKSRASKRNEARIAKQEAEFDSLVSKIEETSSGILRKVASDDTSTLDISLYALKRDIMVVLANLIKVITRWEKCRTRDSSGNSLGRTDECLKKFIFGKHSRLEKTSCACKCGGSCKCMNKSNANDNKKKEKKV